jgi:hypothetical protein
MYSPCHGGSRKGMLYKVTYYTAIFIIIPGIASN